MGLKNHGLAEAHGIQLRLAVQEALHAACLPESGWSQCIGDRGHTVITSTRCMDGSQGRVIYSCKTQKFK